jgi:hypothetical protein
LIGHPYLLKVHLVVGMDQDVPHPRHGSPGHFGVELPCAETDVLARLASNFKTANYGILKIFLPDIDQGLAIARVLTAGLLLPPPWLSDRASARHGRTGWLRPEGPRADRHRCWAWPDPAPRIRFPSGGGGTTRTAAPVPWPPVLFSPLLAFPARRSATSTCTTTVIPPGRPGAWRLPVVTLRMPPASSPPS